MIIYSISILLVAFIIIAISFTSCSPQFGGSISKQKKELLRKSKNYKDGKFTIPVQETQKVEFFKIVRDMFKSVPNGRPLKTLDMVEIDSVNLVSTNHDSTRITWLGHSTFLVQMDGLNILIDPMIGEYASPFKIKRGKRFNNIFPISIEKLPFIDIVIYSHDHYDHLDYGTLIGIKDKVGKFLVPLGVGAHLTSWGVDDDKIIEHDWWDSSLFGNTKFVCTPAMHFSSRGFFDNNTTLWSSWCLIGSTGRIYFSGDGGYGKHFEEVGEKYGPFDISLIECGQYDLNWKFLHMMPEESVKASIDVKSKVMMPIHWGSFKLANHEWTEPVIRARNEAKLLNVQITTPRIGEFVNINSEKLFTDEWWLK